MHFVPRVVRALPFALGLALGAAHGQTVQPVAATPSSRERSSEVDLLKRLRDAFPASRIDAVATTPIDGLFEVVAGPNVFYADRSARYVMFGKLFDMKTRTDITTARIAQVQRHDVSILPHVNAIRTVRGNGSRVLYVFADPNCGYCKALENTLQDVDNVTVYTYLVPLLGPDSFEKARAIWCSADRAKAWSDWMGRGIKPAEAAVRCDDPIDVNADLSKKLDMPGTPMMLSADGRRLMGAVTAADIESLLSKTAAVATASPTTKTAR